MNKREQMVEEIKKHYGLDSPGVFSAMLQVPREKFVRKRYRNIAYRDAPVPIDHGQTMSQPYTVAFMTDLLLRGDEPHNAPAPQGKKVLEIGTGSGYQAAVLSHLAKEVYTIEIIPELARKASTRLKNLGYKNVYVKTGSGEWGWEEHAPYNAILVTAAIEKEVPQALLGQLKDGGVLVAPIGKGPDKQMTRLIKRGNRFKKEEHGIFSFVPFVKEPN
ncbi:MAG: protein-L-isoaspartate(D-aspartate) O-methyltransferase [Patescibacteria group bacterium]